LVIDTNACEAYAGRVHRLRTQIVFADFTLASRHQTILAKIESLRQYFLTMARQAAATESSLPITTSSSSVGQPRFSYGVDLRPVSQLLKKPDPMRANASASLHYLSVGSVYSTKYFEQKTSMQVGNAQASGECTLQLWNEKKQFDPKLALSAQLDGSLLDVASHTRVGTDMINATLDASGKVGAASASAQVVMSADEQTFQAQGHVAALEGEAVLAFHLFGASVSVKGSGSLLSAGGDISYSHKNREWEMGAKLGFIAGLGLKVHVKY